MIKTTKETHKQDETFKGKVAFDSYDNVYANVDGEMKSLPEYIAEKGVAPSNMMTTDTEQVITGTKHFDHLSIQNEDGSKVFKIEVNESTKGYNSVSFTRKIVSGGYDDMRYRFSNSFGYLGQAPFFVIGIIGDKVCIGAEYYGNTHHYFYLPITDRESTKEDTLAITTDINATTALTLTNTSGHCYTGKISTSNKVECIVDIDGTYTANFNIAKGMKTAFLMVYGTSSSDVATCFATMDSSGLVTIDLDNVSLSSFTPTCKYIIYN